MEIKLFTINKPDGTLVTGAVPSVNGECTDNDLTAAKRAAGARGDASAVILEKDLASMIRDANLGTGIYTLKLEELRDILVLPSPQIGNRHLEYIRGQLIDELHQDIRHDGPEAVEEHIRLTAKHAEGLWESLAIIVRNFVIPQISEKYHAGTLPALEYPDLNLPCVEGWNNAAIGKPETMPLPDWAKLIQPQAWQVFADLLSEEIERRDPDFKEKADDLIFIGYQDDEALRERAAEIVTQAVLPMVLEGTIRPNFSQSTCCKTSFEYIKFGMENFEPVLVDMNDEPLLVAKTLKTSSAEPSF